MLTSSFIDDLIERVVCGDIPVLYVHGPRRVGKSLLINKIVARCSEAREGGVKVGFFSGEPRMSEDITRFDIVVIDDLDQLDEANALRLRSAIVNQKRPQTVLIASEHAPTDSTVRSLLNIAKVLNLQEFETHDTFSNPRLKSREFVESPERKTELPKLTLYVDPGTASPETIGKLLSEISLLYRMIGGSGITFTNAASTVPVVSHE
jgi:hypothetical protein